MSSTGGRSSVLIDRVSWTVLDWAFVVLAGVLALVNLSVAVATGQNPLFVVGAGYVVLAALPFTRYWRPTLSLVAVGYSFALGVIWLLNGMRFFRVGVLTGAVSLVFVGVALALFYRTNQSDRRRQTY